MSDHSTNYQCPNCMGPLHFSSETGKLQCAYCGSSYTPEEMEALNKKAIDSEATEVPSRKAAESWGEEASKMRSYCCSSCGAELLCEETTAATVCPYCGNPTIVPGQFHGTLKPDYVIPFKLNKKDAVAALKQHYRKKLLLPSVFAQQNHLEEVRGLYVPFWLFNGEATADMHYHGTTSMTHRDGNYRVTNTSHYEIQRSGSLKFQMVPVDGSEKMPDALMDSLEPYDYKDLVPFTTAYLPGYMADKYDVDAHQASDRAKTRCTATIENEIRDTVHGYSTLVLKGKNIGLSQEKVYYALLPVWLLITQWKDKKYFFAMNGQTGKIVGDLPIDSKKKNLLFWGTLIGLSLVLTLTVRDTLGRFLYQFLLRFFS